MTTRELFARHKLRCTAQRLALYEALRGCKTHPTAEELYQRVRQAHGSISLATVYNTLEALCNAGLAQKLPTTNGCCRYDGDTSDHLHLRLRDTAEVCDVPAELGERLQAAIPDEVLAEVEDELGVSIERVRIQLIGRRRPDR